VAPSKTPHRADVFVTVADAIALVARRDPGLLRPMANISERTTRGLKNRWGSAETGAVCHKGADVCGLTRDAVSDPRLALPSPGELA
jgi:hypothetical protein